ncbi:hypothetical protein, variant 2 [Aphanomyces astaci]|uniref:histone deacetylase n=1 Tax=Aphanomyces astaci TaxID=112090 RepID=W4G647_APHAT|nr:hypothetical protein, variant 2 [Aphanomyces astaci]ETV74524.1 hypothetical protein, variant 2 [Aphanomyces astaci]|eukprot:XP_009836182.1 hypothetical protein, variant 2 [Aphanomyces astaci]
MEATSEKRLRPILTSILTTSANTSRNSTPKSTTSSTSITVPPMKRRVSFTNLVGNPELPIPDKLEDILEADLNRTPSGKPLESTSPTRVVETTDLHHACRHLDVDRAAVFLAHASSDSVNFVSVEDGYSALTLAAMAPDSHFDVSLRLAQLLTHHGASVSLPDSQGFTALHWCAAVGNASVLQHLLAMAPSSCMDLPGANGDTALHRASRFGHADCIRLLLLHGASTCALTLDMHTPLDVAGFADGSTVYEASRTAARAAFMSSRPQLKTLVLHHPDCHEHMTAASHQESPLRLAAILDPILQHPQETIHVDVSSSSFHPSGMMVVSSDFAFVSLSVVRRVHSAKYVDTLKALHHQVQSHTDGCMALTPRLQVHVQGTAVAAAKLESICDTNFSRGTLKAALRAAGSVCHAVHAVAMGKYRNAFCVVRPPGHHAGWSGLLKDSISCGFCILNNVMIGAQYALDTCPHVKKVAIVDFDAHHGNGTQDILTQHPRPNVLFISLHVFAEGFYPGSGGDHDYARNIYNFPIHPMWTHAKDKGSAAFRAKVTQDSTDATMTLATNSTVREMAPLDWTFHQGTSTGSPRSSCSWRISVATDALSRCWKADTVVCALNTTTRTILHPTVRLQLHLMGLNLGPRQRTTTPRLPHSSSIPCKHLHMPTSKPLPANPTSNLLLSRHGRPHEHPRQRSRRHARRGRS